MIKKLFIKESILDPIRDDLSIDLWENKKLLPSVKKYLLDSIQSWFNSIDQQYDIENLLIAGSITGYQYISTSDIDVKIQLNISDEKVNELYKLLPNGRVLPGTKHPVNYYILNKPFDLVNKGSIYDILADEWLIAPEKDGNNISMPYIVELSKIFMTGIDDRVKEYERDIKEIEIYYSYLKSNAHDKKEVEKYLERKKIEVEAGLDGLNIIFDMIWKFRDEGYQSTENPRDFFMFDKTLGHYSIQNQVYKLLEKFGYLDLLKKYKNIRDLFMNEIKNWDNK